MEGARRDEENVVGLHGSMFGADRGALDQRQQIPLHALARHIRAAAIFASADLVDLVEEDDAVVLHVANRLLHHLVLIEQLLALFGDERREGFPHGDAARLGLAAEGLAENIPQRDRPHGGAGHVGQFEHGHAPAAPLLHLDLDLLVVEFVGAQLLAEGIAGGRRGGRPHQRVQHPLLGGLLGAGFDALALALLDQRNADLHEIPDDLLDVAADITDLGELGRLHLQEGGAGEAREAARDFRLAAAGGADHQDVLGQHLVAHGALELQPPPAVSQRDGHRALGVLLPDNVAVELGNDLAR